MAYKKSSGRIANKLKGLIKDRIKELGLIDTGLLYDSVMVYPDGDDYVVKTEDYFKYLDGDYDILSYCINSTEFLDYIKETILDDINIELNEYISK